MTTTFLTFYNSYSFRSLLAYHCLFPVVYVLPRLLKDKTEEE